jgi:hypothetical protein
MDQRVISYPKAQLIANVWVISGQNADLAQSRLALFTSGLTNSMINKQTGLLHQKSTNIPPELMAQNYTYAYLHGDITSPMNSPILVVQKENVKSKKKDGKDMRAYVAKPETCNSQTNAQFAVIPQEVMASRYDISNPETFLNIPTEESLIESLVAVLNRRSPTGIHEYALLRQVFPTHRIPEPQAAPAASTTVQSGFQAQPPTNGGFPVPKVASAGFTPPVATQPPAGYGYQPQAQAPVAQAPYSVPQAQPQAPAQAPQYAPYVPAAPQAAPAPVAPQYQPQPQAPAAQAPTIPPAGQPFDRNAFLAQLQAGLNQNK